jgi:hypothetical protein
VYLICNLSYYTPAWKVVADYSDYATHLHTNSHAAFLPRYCAILRSGVYQNDTSVFIKRHFYLILYGLKESAVLWDRRQKWQNCEFVRPLAGYTRMEKKIRYRSEVREKLKIDNIVEEKIVYRKR